MFYASPCRLAFVALVAFLPEKSVSFAPSKISGDGRNIGFAYYYLSMRNMATTGDSSSNENWISLVDNEKEPENPPVRKLILEEGTGQIPTKGSSVELEYTGTLVGERGWSAEDVINCWLSQLQGLDQLSPLFQENNIDGNKLMDETFFTEAFCMEQLGISNKIQAKKLIMASRRLSKQQEDHARGTVFDSSTERGRNFSFVLGKGKAIKAVDLAAGSMKLGERAKVICRSDYGYGPEGLRTSKGGIMVPPFASLCFELKLVSSGEE